MWRKKYCKKIKYIKDYKKKKSWKNREIIETGRGTIWINDRGAESSLYVKREKSDAHRDKQTDG